LGNGEDGRSGDEEEIIATLELGRLFCFSDFEDSKRKDNGKRQR